MPGKEPKWVRRTSSFRGARLGTEFVGGFLQTPVNIDVKLDVNISRCRGVVDEPPTLLHGLLSKDYFQPQHLDTTFPMRDEHVILLRVESQLHDGFFQMSSLRTLPVHLVANSF